MSERWWKPPLGRLRLLHPSFCRMAVAFRHFATHPCFRYLAIGPYAWRDMNWLAAPGYRAHQWGYFVGAPQGPSRHGRADGPLRLLYAGRLLAWKQVDLIVRALTLVPEELCRLHLIGDGPMAGALDRLILRLGLAHRVSREPFLPHNVVLARMLDHDALVLASNGYEGWGAVINEAMGLGLPVIASDATGAGMAMITHGSNGMLFRSGDPAALARCIRRMAEDPDGYQRCQRLGYATTRDLWSPQVAANRLIDLADAWRSRAIYHPPEEGPLALWSDWRTQQRGQSQHD